jgi:uncharacterized membrane protein
MPTSDVPPGWDYNPSAWSQRLPVVALAVVGGLLAAYLALYQVRVVGRVWDPFFGRDSERVLDSKISRLLPVSDAALGAFGYLLDAVTGLVGGRRRWRTLPWLVVLFGVLVGPLGVVSIALVIAQPLAVGAWCSLCLATAAISVAMIAPAMDEVLASLQYLKRIRDQDRTHFWPAFWGRRAAA